MNSKRNGLLKLTTNHQVKEVIPMPWLCSVANYIIELELMPTQGGRISLREASKTEQGPAVALAAATRR
jgi:hypothetical protein